MNPAKSIFHREGVFFNAEEAWRRYTQAPGSFKFPERITVEVTNRCSLSCHVCPRNSYKMDLGDMDFELYRRIIDEASGFLPICLVPFFRGEPLLHPKFIEMVSYAKDKGLKPIQIATNIYFLTERLGEEMLGLGVDFISFSIDTTNPAICGKLRQKSGLGQIFKKALWFLQEKSARGLNLPLIQVSTVKAAQDRSVIDNFINFWKDKADRVRVYPAHSLDGRLGCLPDEEGTSEARRPCLKPLTDMVIYSNGEVAICNHDWQRSEYIGNVKEDSIGSIWRGTAYESLRNRHLSGRILDFSPCSTCSHWRSYYRKDYVIGEVYEKDALSAC